MSRFIGIDFSGGARPWRTSIARPTVWIAVAEIIGSRPQLISLMPVQSLPGDELPFDRLVRFLARRDFEVAAIDAPFSLPLAHMPRSGHAELLRSVRALPNGHDRPFPLGASLVALGEVVARKLVAKPLRRTEEYWLTKGVNTRSTMWNGPRGGAPFAAACLRLLERVELPCWPWTQPQVGTLGEAFPAAQLRQWGLPHQAYSKQNAEHVRCSILTGLRERISIRPVDADVLRTNADALDAVISVFGAIAISERSVVGYNIAHTDGNIAVAE